MIRNQSKLNKLEMTRPASTSAAPTTSSTWALLPSLSSLDPDLTGSLQETDSFLADLKRLTWMACKSSDTKKIFCCRCIKTRDVSAKGETIAKMGTQTGHEVHPDTHLTTLTPPRTATRRRVAATNLMQAAPEDNFTITCFKSKSSTTLKKNIPRISRI